MKDALEVLQEILVAFEEAAKRAKFDGGMKKFKLVDVHG
jgi:hypothetical protein